MEEEYRKKGIAGCILNFIRKEFKNKGVKKLYLVTEHTNFYEKYGWNFFMMVNDDMGEKIRMYVIDC